MTPPDASLPDRTIRLQKFLAQAGHGSRRACEQFILAGRVTIDGRIADQLGVRIDPGQQAVALDGESVRVERKQHFLLNKPRGYLCTNHDPRGRRRVIDLFPTGGPRLFTVGRLDENSQGLLLVTNDGDLAHRLVHPRYQIPRFYRVQVAGKPNREDLATLQEGTHFSEGVFRVHSARHVKTQGNSTFLDLELRQGQNREIRRLLARLGHKVMQLQRTGFGPLRLGRLKTGKFRTLKSQEHKALRDCLSGEPGQESGRRNSRQRSSKVRRSGKGPRARTRSRHRRR